MYEWIGDQPTLQGYRQRYPTLRRVGLKSGGGERLQPLLIHTKFHLLTDVPWNLVWINKGWSNGCFIGTTTQVIANGPWSLRLSEWNEVQFTREYEATVFKKLQNNEIRDNCCNDRVLDCKGLLLSEDPGSSIYPIVELTREFTAVIAYFIILEFLECL